MVEAFNQVGTTIARVVTAPVGVPLEKAVDACLFLMVKTKRPLSNYAAEGVSSVAARHGDDALEQLDALRTTMKASLNNSDELADDAFESVTEAIGKAYGNIGSAADNRVADGLAAARHIGKTSNYESIIADFVGSDKVIKSREELEHLLRMRADDLREEQVAAINQLRLAVGMPHPGEPLARIVSLDGTFGAENLLQSGNPNLGGFFARKADIVGTNSTQSLINRLRLDASPNNFIPGQAHAVIETRATQAIRDTARIPRSLDYSTGGPLDIVDDFHYPGTGNGFTAATDGHLVPEFRIPDSSPVPMTAGYDLAGNPVTIMKIRNPDGNPFPLTIEGHTASEWKLLPHPTTPGQFVWRPLSE